MLRAIHKNVDINDLGLETEPGRKIAWTLQNYGAYQVEEVPWSKIEIGVEDSPRGSVPVDFEQDWGYEFITKDEDRNPWYRDILKIIAQLHIVANNSPDNIGGGGVPLRLLAPPFQWDSRHRLN